MTALVYDAGALIAAERSDRRLTAIHARALGRGVLPVVPATALAQVWRGRSRNLADVLDGCHVVDLTRRLAQQTGELLAAAGGNDIADAHVVMCCIALEAACVTSDPGDIENLAEAARTCRPRLTRRRVPILVL